MARNAGLLRARRALVFSPGFGVWVGWHETRNDDNVHFSFYIITQSTTLIFLFHISYHE